MKFKLDEKIPVELVEDLRAAGHEAATVHDEAATGASAPELLDLVKGEGRILLTLDKG